MLNSKKTLLANFKNLTIRQITLIITVLVVALNLLIGILIYNYGIYGIPKYYLVICIPFIFVINFFAIRYFLEYFVFRKIKLIYKLINSEKSSLPDDEFINYNVTTLDSIKQDVEDYTLKTEKEISTLKSLEDYRKTFVGNISHELKTPIFSIQGYLHTLLEGGMYDNRILKQYLERAISNVERLQYIIDDLDIITRLESGEEKMEFEKIDIKALVTEVYYDMEILAAEKNIKLTFKLGADNHFLVKGHKESLRRVFTNLIINSIKYGKNDGTTKAGFYSMDNNILIEISDNGLGIDEKHLKHVFDRFYRVDNSRSRSEGGSGLGLSIVKHIIEVHKSKISVRSTVNQGSTFSFTLLKA
jgi:two-component system phosphate regulon sensor histidine kinase PhoR